MNYKKFSYLQFKRLLKNSFHSILINLKDTRGEKIPLCLWELLGLFYFLKKFPVFISNEKHVTTWLLQDE